MSTKVNICLERVTHIHTEPRNRLGLVGIEKTQKSDKYIKLVM